ncbi:cytochrome c biogenesis protein CcdA, partial [Acinetobacter baumannii]
MLELTVAALLTAFIGGIASFLSPCVLPLVPGYLSYIAGGSTLLVPVDSDNRAERWRALGLSGC